ncbi:TPA: hypothetical protein ACM6Y6_004157, partial [Escherichia coli]
ISNMILYVLSNNHIICPFSAAQLRLSGSYGSSSSPSLRHSYETQYVALFSINYHECCVSPRIREPFISGRKDHFAYSLIVIHFRKIMNPIKIGSWKNSYPVI